MRCFKILVGPVAVNAPDDASNSDLFWAFPAKEEERMDSEVLVLGPGTCILPNHIRQVALVSRSRFKRGIALGN